MALPLSGGARAGDIFALAAEAENKGYSSAKAEAAGRAATAAVHIVKLSRGLPAVLAANVTNINSDLMHSIVASRRMRSSALLPAQRNRWRLRAKP
jgi:hypothetical protein